MSANWMDAIKKFTDGVKEGVITNNIDLVRESLEEFMGERLAGMSVKEIENSDNKTTNTVVKNKGTQGKATKAVTKITKESGIQAGLSAGTALGAVRQVIKAKFSEMIAGLLAREITTKGFMGVLTGAAMAGAASQLFEQVVPKVAATGMNEVVTKPTMILAGEAGAESVQITPLNSAMNVNGVQGGSNITLNISAPLVDDTVVDHIIPAINEAVRRGETLATS